MSAVVHDFRGPRIPAPPSNLRNLTPIQQTEPAGHPSVYDHEQHPDRPTLPRIVALSASVLIQHARNPVAVPRPAALEAAEIVEAWAKGDERDSTSPYGTERGA